MNTDELVDNFINHSPGFHDDLELKNVDEKHKNILAEAYNEIKSGEAFSIKNFRNWAQQTDLTVPAQLSLYAIRSQGIAKALLRYIYRKLFGRDVDKFLKSAILDDIEVIKMVGGEYLLKENPVHLTPGVRESYNIYSTSVNLRWLRYIYITSRILQQDLQNNAIWVDVGCYYGGLQGLVRKYRPDLKIVLVDFHHQLCRSYIYLSSLFPDAKHVLPDQLSDTSSLSDLPAGSITYVPVSEYGSIGDDTAGLVTNFFSLGEMRREFFSSYMDSKLFRESEKVYLVNRVVSAPLFEKTYDSDVSMFDYYDEKRNTDCYDIFPMHHYLLTKRKLFGRLAFRNLSSPYFEMITSKPEQE